MATYTLEIEGAITPLGTALSEPKKVLTGAITPSGALVKGRKLFQTGTIAPAGVLVTEVTRILGGTLTPVGSFPKTIEHTFVGSFTPSGQLLTGRGEVACNVTVGEFKVRLGALLDDPTHIYYTEAAILHALNVGQRLFALITLCIERTVTIALTNGQDYYDLSAQLTDYLLPLRVTHSGVQLKPDTLNNLDLRNRAWRATAGTPTRYAREGLDRLWITPQPASGVHTLEIVCACEPAALVLDTDIPEVPGDQSTALEDFAVWWLRFFEGGQEHANTLVYLRRFLDDASKYAAFVRAKNRAQGYDNWPPELSLYDKSRFEVKLARESTWRRMNKQEGENGNPRQS